MLAGGGGVSETFHLLLDVLVSVCVSYARLSHDAPALEHHHAGALPARGQCLARAEKAVGTRQLPALCASPVDWDGAGGREQEHHGDQHVHPRERSPAARLASLAEERSVHPLAWRQVLTTGKADRTRVSRAIGVGPQSGTGVITGTDDAPGAACKPSLNNPLRYRTTRGHNASGRT